MPTYKFEQFKTEIVDPTIDISPVVTDVNPITMTISADIVMIDSSGSKFGIHLENIAVQG